MTQRYCDVCGKLLTDNDRDRFERASFMHDPGGYFTPAHAMARVNDKGEVVSHQWSDGLVLCTECQSFFNFKIWEALEERRGMIPKSRTIKITAPFRCKVLPETYEEPVRCTCDG